MTEQSPKRIGDYEVLSELGRGGMGRVYRVRNTISDRVEAMKILLPDLAGRDELAARFLREIKLVASLDHPNIAALRTALTIDNQLVMVMEFVEGTNLASLIERGPIPVADAARITDQVLSALAYAHTQKIIHRDIKPANIMLTPEGVVKLMDFGIAFSGGEHSLTTTGTTLGSLAYMPPEQVRGEVADERSDMYSLGISLYEMVTGQRPFKADSDYSIMAAHLKETPRAPIDLQPGLPAALNEIILTAIAKDPAQRFQSANAFQNALRNVGIPGYAADNLAVPAAAVTAGMPAPVSHSQPSAPRVPTKIATPPPPPAQPQRAGGYRGLYMTLGALVVLALVVAAGVYYKSGAEDSNSAPSALTPEKKDAAPADTAPTPTPEAPKTESAPPPPAPAPATPPPVAETKPEPPPDNTAELEELENQIDHLSGRVLAADASLETLRQQQRASGFGLRGDIVAKQEIMKSNLAKAREAHQNGDVARTRRFIGLAENATAQLEKFLGR